MGRGNVERKTEKINKADYVMSLFLCEGGKSKTEGINNAGYVVIQSVCEGGQVKG